MVTQDNADLHELSVNSWPDLIELAHNSMLGHINGHFSQEDLATLPEQVLVRQPVPTVIHLLYLVPVETVTQNEEKLDVAAVTTTYCLGQHVMRV